VYGARADRLSRLAVLERSEKDIAALKETSAPPLIRIALAAAGGILLLLGQSNALCTWLGAASFMLSVCGASPLVAMACGAIAAAIACFRVFGSYDGKAVFWLVLCLQAAGGALAGAVAGLISKRLPPQAFPFLAALLPAGLEHLGGLGSFGPIASTALTQYAHPSVICIGRLGGLGLVTYVIFLFGGAFAVAVRYVQSPGIAIVSSAPAAGAVFLALLYGAASTAVSKDSVEAVAFNLNSLLSGRQQLASRQDYDRKGWTDYIEALMSQAGRLSRKKSISRALDGPGAERATQILVWPEAAGVVDAEDMPKFVNQIESIAKITKCVQAAAYYDTSATESVAIITDITSVAARAYTRRSFVYGVDDSFLAGQVVSRGIERPRAVDTPIGKAGVILSLDANDFGNFASIARSGGRLACVCGLDDVAVPETSLRLLAVNAALSGMAVVKATDRGTLAAINPDGKIIDTLDALEKIDSELDTSVPLGNGGTIFLFVGNLFSWLALLAGIAAALFASSKPAPREGPERQKPSSSLSYKTKEGAKNV
jgi:apolipoprotein N-acyltransferase